MRVGVQEVIHDVGIDAQHHELGCTNRSCRFSGKPVFVKFLLSFAQNNPGKTGRRID